MDLVTAYRVLDAPIGASAAVIKVHYRRKIALFHPDRNRSDEAHTRATEINRAFNLIDRAGYPSEAEVRLRSRASGRGFGAGFEDDFAAKPNREQRNWESRRSGYGSPPPKSGRTVHRKVKLTLEEAIKGKTITLEGYVTEKCPRCDGARRLYVKCSDCDGKGFVVGRGQPRSCVACAGSGSRVVRCTACHGTGNGGRRNYSAKVRIPAGVRDGAILRAEGSARRKEGDPAGFKLEVHILEHELFYFEAEEEGRLAIVVPIHALQFLLRETVPVPTPWGDRAVRPTASPWIDIPDAGFPDRKAAKRGVLRVYWDFVDSTADDPELDAQVRQLLERLKTRGRAIPRMAAWEETVAQWKRRTRGS